MLWHNTGHLKTRMSRTSGLHVDDINLKMRLLDVPGCSEGCGVQATGIVPQPRVMDVTKAVEKAATASIVWAQRSTESMHSGRETCLTIFSTRTGQKQSERCDESCAHREQCYSSSSPQTHSCPLDVWKVGEKVVRIPSPPGCTVQYIFPSAPRLGCTKTYLKAEVE